MAIKDIYRLVIDFDPVKLPELVQAEVNAGTDIETILNKGLINGMNEVGKRFSEGILFVPEMLMSAKTMKAGLEVLRPYLTGSGDTSKGTIVLGTVEGDLHDIGKNLVGLMLEGAGFKVIDLGIDVKSRDFAKAAKDNQADLVALSALLTTTMPAMEATVTTLKELGPGFKIMVGGAPVTQSFADGIGADGYSGNAAGAAGQAKKLIAAP